jgi:hypothetical protein
MQNFGVMLFKDIIIKENLLKYYTLNESNFLYKKRIQELKSKGYTIDAIVSDVRKVFVQSFGVMPVQT